LATSSIRVLVVDDYEPFRQFLSSSLQSTSSLYVYWEASDGLEAVQKAEELQPDLILLDIGLPNLNGIEAARRIRKISPESKILFVSQESSAEVVQESLGLGGRGYVVKTDARRELLQAIDVVLRGERFVGRRFSGHDFVGGSHRSLLRPGMQYLCAYSRRTVQGGMETHIYDNRPHNAARYGSGKIGLERNRGGDLECVSLVGRSALEFMKILNTNAHLLLR